MDGDGGLVCLTENGLLRHRPLLTSTCMCRKKNSSRERGTSGIRGSATRRRRAPVLWRTESSMLKTLIRTTLARDRLRLSQRLTPLYRRGNISPAIDADSTSSSNSDDDDDDTAASFPGSASTLKREKGSANGRTCIGPRRIEMLRPWPENGKHYLRLPCPLQVAAIAFLDSRGVYPLQPAILSFALGKRVEENVLNPAATAGCQTCMKPGDSETKASGLDKKSYDRENKKKSLQARRSIITHAQIDVHFFLHRLVVPATSTAAPD